MPYNGAGTFSLTTGNPVVTGTTISSTWANNTLSDIVNNGLTNCITKDGQQTVTANIPFNGNRLTGVGAGISATDAATVSQIQSGAPVTLTGISGTGDAIVASSVPAITAYTSGQSFVYIPTATNTVTNPTINISSVGVKPITQSNGAGLWAGALVVGTPYELMYDGTNFRVQSGQLGAFIVQMSSPFAFRNRFIDGNFDIWGSGTTFNLTAGGGAAYTSTMWVCSSGGGAGAATVSRAGPFAGTEPLGMESPVNFAMQFQQTAGATVSNPIISQRIENVTTLQGRSATFSCWLKVASGTLSSLSLSLTQSFGVGGSASVVTSVSLPWTVTTAWQYFSARVDLPTISGKTLGTLGTDFLGVGLVFPQGTTFTALTNQWQLEDCPAGAPVAGLPTPFEWRGFADERNMVNRFFQIQQSTIRFNAAGAGGIADVPIYLSPAMRIGPAVTLNAAGTRTNVASATVSNVIQTGARYEVVSTAAGDTFATNDTWIFDARF